MENLTFGEWVETLANSRHSFGISRIAGVMRVSVDAI